MVSIQEVELKIEELERERQKALQYVSQKIPTRRFRSGVSRQEQQQVLLQRKQAREYISEADKRKQELSKLKEDIRKQEAEQQRFEEEESRVEQANKLLSKIRAGKKIRLDPKSKTDQLVIKALRKRDYAVFKSQKSVTGQPLPELPEGFVGMSTPEGFEAVELKTGKTYKLQGVSTKEGVVYEAIPVSEKAQKVEIPKSEKPILTFTKAPSFAQRGISAVYKTDENFYTSQIFSPLRLTKFGAEELTGIYSRIEQKQVQKQKGYRSYQPIPTETGVRFAFESASYFSPAGSGLLVLSGSEQLFTKRGREGIKETEKGFEQSIFKSIKKPLSFALPISEIGFGIAGIGGQVRQAKYLREFESFEKQPVKVTGTRRIKTGQRKGTDILTFEKNLGKTLYISKAKLDFKIRKGKLIYEKGSIITFRKEVGKLRADFIMSEIGGKSQRISGKAKSVSKSGDLRIEQEIAGQTGISRGYTREVTRGTLKAKKVLILPDILKYQIDVKYKPKGIRKELFPSKYFPKTYELTSKKVYSSFAQVAKQKGKFIKFIGGEPKRIKGTFSGYEEIKVAKNTKIKIPIIKKALDFNFEAYGKIKVKEIKPKLKTDIKIFRGETKTPLSKTFKEEVPEIPQAQLQVQKTSSLSKKIFPRQILGTKESLGQMKELLLPKSVQVIKSPSLVRVTERERQVSTQKQEQKLRQEQEQKEILRFKEAYSFREAFEQKQIQYQEQKQLQRQMQIQKQIEFPRFHIPKIPRIPRTPTTPRIPMIPFIFPRFKAKPSKRKKKKGFGFFDELIIAPDLTAKVFSIPRYIKKENILKEAKRRISIGVRGIPKIIR